MFGNRDHFDCHLGFDPKARHRESSSSLTLCHQIQRIKGNSSDYNPTLIAVMWSASSSNSQCPSTITTSYVLWLISE